MRFRCQFCVLMLMVCGSGCALLNFDLPDRTADETRDTKDPNVAQRPSTVPVKRIVHLQSTHVVQPLKDRRQREQVWEEMSEIIERSMRRQLNENGFRVAVSGSPYPWALGNLLDSAGRRSGNRPSQRNRQQLYFSASGSGSSRVPIALAEDGESLIEVRRGTAAEIPDGVTVPGLNGISPGEQIRCMLRIRSIEHDDYGVLLRFMPELHFGREVPRLTVNDVDDRLAVRQKWVPLFDNQFELKLHPDDAIVLGHYDQDEWTIGRFFFQSDSLNGAEESLMVLRVDQIETVEGRRSMQVHYSKY